MGSQAGRHLTGERSSVDYRRLLAMLASRAARLGSRDPESAAQEALKRSLENVNSQPAIEHYFSEPFSSPANPPDWPLARLYAWLYGVLHYVVREEQSRAGFHRETPMGAVTLDPADSAPDALDNLLKQELAKIVEECLPKLDREYRDVLKMRGEGMKYGEIARRMGVSENTVATWVSRGIRDLAGFVRKRTRGLHE